MSSSDKSHDKQKTKSVANPVKRNGKPGGKLPFSKAHSKREEEFYRPPTRAERLRDWLERVPRLKLYAVLTGITWLLLTLIVGLDTSHLRVFGLDQKAYYQVGDISGRDEFATRAVTYEDPVATAQARDQAANEMQEIYQSSEAVPGDVNRNVTRFFERATEIRSSDLTEGEQTSRMSEISPFTLSNDSARALVFASREDFDDVKRYTEENLQELYTTTSVADDGVAEIPATSVIRVSEARTRLSEAASRDASGESGDLVEILSRGFVEPSYVINREATDQARNQAANNVEPVQSTVQPGERIVARGEVIEREDVAQLEALGKISGNNPWTVLLGVGIVVAVQLWIVWYFMERFGSKIFQAKGAIKLLLTALLVVLFTILARVFILFSLPSSTIPLAGLSILGTILLGPRLMFLVVVVTSVNIGIIGGNDFMLAAALLVSSGFAIYTVVRVDSRDKLLKAGLVIALVTAVVTFAISLVGGASLSLALWQGVLGLVNGLLSLMIAMVLLPALENTFNLLTPMKLLELSDLGSPLLQKLLRKAPGTFSHSMQVGVLAENAANRIGADPLLARVGAYHHDIGKMEHPAYFVENQIGQMNPHDALSPTLSAKIIKRHVKDGIDIGHAWGLPQEILDIIAQHHGLTRIEYFYRKALEESPEGTVRESDFRYSRGRPKSREAGIIMLADTVEATVRALPKPTPKRIEEVIASTIRRKLDDGQFDECELTLREIHEVGEAIRESVIGFLGPRIEYPDDSPEGRAIRKPGRKIAGNPT